MLDLHVRSDTEMCNFFNVNLKKMGFTLKPCVSLPKKGINRLYKGTDYYFLFQLESSPQIWLGSFQKKTRSQKSIKIQMFDFS